MVRADLGPAPFCIDSSEVTNAHYAAFLAATGNGMPIWSATSLGLAVTGRRGRRAALEGAAALALASAASNLMVKPAVGRRRPVPIPRRGRPKTTMSFPSSHATTSFAYASAVTARWPAAGAPLLAVAAVIAGSRVHTRQHRIADVVAGAVLGATIGVMVAALSRRARPPAPEGPDRCPA